MQQLTNLNHFDRKWSNTGPHYNLDLILTYRTREYESAPIIRSFHPFLIQWALLIQALVSRKDSLTTDHSPPQDHCFVKGQRRAQIHWDSPGNWPTTLCLRGFNRGSISFNRCKADLDKIFRPSSLKLVRGEALIVNCMLHHTHIVQRGTSSVALFLAGAKLLNPRLVNMVEDETGPSGDQGFVSRFMDTLHHYSALYDSLEPGFPLQGRARALVERVFLGPRISQSLARIYCACGHGKEAGEEGFESWGEWLVVEMDFEPVTMSFANQCQARLLLGLFNTAWRV